MLYQIHGQQMATGHSLVDESGQQKDIIYCPVRSEGSVLFTVLSTARGLFFSLCHVVHLHWADCAMLQLEPLQVVSVPSSHKEVKGPKPYSRRDCFKFNSTSGYTLPCAESGIVAPHAEKKDHRHCHVYSSGALSLCLKDVSLCKWCFVSL